MPKPIGPGPTTSTPPMQPSETRRPDTKSTGAPSKVATTHDGVDAPSGRDASLSIDRLEKSPLVGAFSSDGVAPMSSADKTVMKELEEVLSQAGSDEIAALRGLYDSILKLEHPAAIKEAHGKLIARFKDLWLQTSPAAWAHRADIADSVDALVDKTRDSNAPLSHLRMADMPQGHPHYDSGDLVVPLVAYGDVQKATELLGGPSSTNAPDNSRAVLEKLGTSGKAEVSGTAKMIDLLTRRAWYQEGILGMFLTWVKRVITSIAGWMMKRESSVTAIAEESIKLGISSTEPVTQIRYVNGEPRETEVLLGPRFLFGKSPHEFKSLNQWFVRDWVPEAREEYVVRAISLRANLQARFGDAPTGVETSLVVGANSNSRVRVGRLEPGHFGDEQILTGKVLSKKAAEELAQQGDNPAYPTGRYTFTTHNLLGRANGVSMDPGLGKLLDPKSEANWLKATQQLGELREKLSQVGNESSEASELLAKVESLEKDLRSHQGKVVQPAQHELLAACFRAFDRSGAVQVIQRLAPADIHNYVAPLDGRPLSHTEAVRVLHARAKAQRDFLADKSADKGASSEELGRLTQELGELDRLTAIFEGQEVVLGRPSQPTVDIRGNLHDSVSTPAILNQPRILAQNDRKIMLFEHDDGAISLHAFIGATGVNRVDVDPTLGNEAMVAGQRVGDMAFGHDTYEATPEGDFVDASEKNTRDDLGKLRLLESLDRGDALGTFPIDGSTVVSYYLPGDFTPLAKVDAFTENVHYRQGEEREIDVEILSRMGDPLLMKTELRTLEALERLFPDMVGETTDVGAATDSILEQMASLDLEQGAAGRYREQDIPVLQFAQGYLTKPESERTLDEKRFVQTLRSSVESRLERVNELDQITDLYKDCFGVTTAAEFDKVQSEIVQRFEDFLLTVNPEDLNDYSREVVRWLRILPPSIRSFLIKSQLARFEGELIKALQKNLREEDILSSLQ